MHSNGWCKLAIHIKINKVVPFFLTFAAVLSFTLMACRDSEIEGDLQWRNGIAKYHRNAPIEPVPLHYLDIGQGEPVVLIHGWADSVYTWHKNLPALAQSEFRIILVDLPGMGQSVIPPQPYTYSIENLSQAVLNLTDHLKLERFTIAGHSMGGAIALYVCLYYPKKINRAIAIAPACYRPSHRTGRFLLKIPGAKSVAGALAGRWTVAYALREVFYNDAIVTDAMINEYTLPFEKSGYVDVITSLALDFFSPAHTQMTQSYNRLARPLLIIWGDKDLWLPPEMGRRLHEQAVSSSLIIIPQAGHNVHQEAHVSVNTHITNFLVPAADSRAPDATVYMHTPSPP